MRFKLRILGSNSALPTSKRFPTAQVLNVHERFFLIDCGEGTQIRLRQYSNAFNKINHLFISHLHGDHFFGILGLLSSFSLLGRTREFNIYAHSKLKGFLDFFTNFLGKELDYELIFHPLNEEFQLLFEDKVCTVHAFPVNHGKIPCSGFLFREKEHPRKLKKEALEKYKIPIRWMEKLKKGEDYITADSNIIKSEELSYDSLPARSYAFCADTAYHEPIIQYVKNVDLLYHEATFSEKEKEKAEEWFHSTALEAARIAKMANTKKLLIGHFSARFKDINLLLEEAKQVFENTIAVNDGDEFEIPLVNYE